MHYTFTITADAAGQRLDQFVHRELPQFSRAFIQKLIADRHVTVDQQPVKAAHRVRPGETVAVTVPPPQPLEARPEQIQLDVLHEDADLVVINKQAGMVVHPAAGNRAGTLVNALLHHCRGQLAGIGGVERPGIVHRLDKDTSGCLVVAKTDRAHRDLVRQFKSRSVTKIYRAVCRGTFAEPAGRVETVIGRSDRNRKKMAVLPADSRRGKQATTEYRVLRQEPDLALVELTLHTGRTHQIRVHLAHLGCPIAGDRVYGRRKSKIQNPKSEIQNCRMMLHAYKLGFDHPTSRERIELTAPMPPEFEEVMSV
jgi:23S rRNA pseudouridine1911/1915/1917 synthase